MYSLWLEARGTAGIAGDDAVAARQGRRGVKHGSGVAGKFGETSGQGNGVKISRRRGTVSGQPKLSASHPIALSEKFIATRSALCVTAR